LVRLKTGILLLSKNAAAELNRCWLAGIDQQETVRVIMVGSGSLVVVSFSLAEGIQTDHAVMETVANIKY